MIDIDVVDLRGGEKLVAIAAPDATGEKQAAFELVEAAKTLAEEPKAIQLRYLQTLTEIAGDKSSTIVFPLDLIEGIKKAIS